MNNLVIASCQTVRSFTTTSCALGKRNFRKFPLFNKRGTRAFKEAQKKNPHPDVPIHTYGVRPIGFKVGSSFTAIKEAIPEMVVPNLEGFKLKPYVSYRTPDVTQGQLTPEELFAAIYGKKIVADYKAGKLGPNGEPLEPSSYEQLTPEEAKKKISQINTDIV